MNHMKDRRLKWLLNTNAPFVPSGYGVEADMLLRRWRKDGWDAGAIGFSGVEGYKINWEGIPIYPRAMDQWGSDGMFHHTRHFGGHFVMSFQDVWTLNPQYLQQVKWIPYLPIDQEPVPPNVLANLRFAYKIITISRFGQKALLKAGFVSKLILEGTDTTIFKPMDKAEARKMLGLPQGAFVVGMVGANKENPPRKGWQQALEAFALFHKKHPDSLFFYQTNQNPPSGFPILPYAHYLGIDKAVFHMDEYMAAMHAGPEVMAKVYNAFDILTHASLTEGFGLCVVEAQSCGVPVIVNNCHSMPELIIPGVTGEICDTGFKWYSNAGGFYHFPDVNSLYLKMEKLYKADRVKMSEAARAHIVKNYNIDTIVENEWIPYFEKLQTELLGPAPVDKPIKTK